MNAQNNFQRLPLLDLVQDHFSMLRLDDYYLLACQNLLGSTHTLLQYLYSKGLQPSRASLLGKCYSTSEKVVDLLRSEGAYVSSYASQFDPHEPYDAQFKRYVLQFVEKRIRSIPQGAKVILLDEGSVLLDACNYFSKEFEMCGIEQSTKPEVLERLKLGFPCITIARCKAKLFAETPFISETIIQKLNHYLERKDLPANEVLIIGGGPLGRQLAADLRKSEYTVHSYDHNAEKSEVLQEELGLKMQNADVIVVCTYGEALQESHLPLLKKGVVLANAALSDRPFPSAMLRKQADKIDTCHDHVIINDGEVHLMNCGFPVNFDGGTHSVPPAKIQITRALLFAAVCESASMPAIKRIAEPDLRMQNLIIRSFCGNFPEQFREFEEFFDS